MLTDTPSVTVTILAKDKAKVLPQWLENLKQWDYPKNRIQLYVRTNDNTDDTEAILKEWINKNVGEYQSYHYDASSINEQLVRYKVHEWNATRFKALAQVRNESVTFAKMETDFYFSIDVDNFIKPDTLSTLVGYNLPVVAPLLYDAGETSYSNYHNVATPNGYYHENLEYYTIHRGKVRGLVLCDVVHCTYLVRSDVLEHLNYADGTEDYEYVIASRNLRKAGIPQYLDNSQLYGWLTMKEDVGAVMRKMEMFK